MTVVDGERTSAAGAPGATPDGGAAAAGVRTGVRRAVGVARFLGRGAVQVPTTLARTRPSTDLPRASVRWALGHALPSGAMAAAAREGDLHSRLVVEGMGGGDVPRDVVEAIRAQGAVHRAKFAFVTATQPVVREVLTSNDFAAGVELGTAGPLAKVAKWGFETAPLGPLTPPSLLVTDPPDHTRYRKLVTRVFSVKAVQALRERTEEIARQLLDDLEAEQAAHPDRPIDLVASYCSLLPVTVIAEILGVPLEDRELVLRFGSAAAPSLDLGLSWETFVQVEDALREFDEWLVRHVERKRQDPGTDLLSQLVAALDDDGVALTDVELRSTAGLVLAAGFETTVNLLGNGVALLAGEHRDQLERLRAEPELWPNAVDEVLRHDPPVLLTGRTAVRDTVVAGTPVPAGAIVTTLLAGANRDPEVFEDPDRFDVARPNAKEHVAFSAGRHFCLGAALARMEGEVGLRALLERYPDLQVVEGGHRRSTRILRGWETLPVRLHG